MNPADGELDQQGGERQARNHFFFISPYRSPGTAAPYRNHPADGLFFDQIVPDLIVDELGGELVSDQADADGDRRHVLGLIGHRDLDLFVIDDGVILPFPISLSGWTSRPRISATVFWQAFQIASKAK